MPLDATLGRGFVGATHLKVTDHSPGMICGALDAAVAFDSRPWQNAGGNCECQITNLSKKTGNCPIPWSL